MNSQLLRRALLAAVPMAALGLVPPQAWAAKPLETVHVNQHHAVRYMSGGVGQQERERMREQAADFDLMVTFARRSDGAYLSNVRVSVLDDKGRDVFTTTTAGPILLATLPDGDYTVRAALQGWGTLERHVHIAHRHRVRSLHVTLEQPASMPSHAGPSAKPAT